MTVTRDDGRSQYVIDVEGDHAGLIAYRERDGVVTMLHTEVDAAFEGKGVGSTLVREALEDVRARGLKLRPLCPFVAAYVKRHPEYQDLVSSAA